RRNQHPAAAIQFQLAGMADQQALEAPGGFIESGQRGNLCLDLFPFRQRIDKETLVLDVDSGDEAAAALVHKLVAIPGGYRHTTFGIQIDWIAASKHVSPRLFLDQFGADRPLCPTLSHKKTLYAALIRSQATGITKSAQNASILREL